MRQSFSVEVTNTFSGEANYSWVRRYEVKAKSFRGAINAVSRREGYRFRKDWDDGEMARYNAIGACVCCFVSL